MTIGPDRSAGAQPRVGAREWMMLAAILALAVAARLFRLDSSLWYDEIYTTVNFVRLPTRQLIATFDSLNNHMAYSLAAQAAVALLGETAAALRLPAVIFGVASIAVQWLIARRVAGPVQALVVALLLAISYHHVWFSQNARGYTELLFWTSAATLVFIDGLDRPAWRTWTAYAICVAAAMYTHLSAGFFFAAHGVVYLALAAAAAMGRTVPRGTRTVQPVYGIGLSIVLTVLLHLPILQQAVTTIGAVSTASGAKDSALGEWRNPLRTAAEVGASIADAGALVPFILLGATVAIIVGGIGLARRQPLLLAIYVVHIPVATLILLALSFRIWPRYFFVDIGFLYLALVHGVFIIAGLIGARWRGGGSVLAGAGVAVMILGSLGLLVRAYAKPKQDFVGARDYVERARQPGDAVAAVGLAGYAYKNYYAPQWRVADTVADLAQVRSGAARTWVLVAFPHQTERARPEVAAVLHRDFTKVAVFPGTLGDGAVWVYRSRAGAM